jgi:hypothetical protein
LFGEASATRLAEALRLIERFFNYDSRGANASLRIASEFRGLSARQYTFGMSSWRAEGTQ